MRTRHFFFVSNHSHSPTTLTPTRACLRSSLASFRATRPRVNATLEPHRRTGHALTHSNAHSSCTDLDTKGIHEVAARRFCLVAAGAHHSLHTQHLDFRLLACPWLAQTTRSCLRSARTRRSSSAPQPTPLTPSTAPRATRLSRPLPCLRRMGEISMMCAASQQLLHAAFPYSDSLWQVAAPAPYPSTLPTWLPS